MENFLYILDMLAHLASLFPSSFVMQNAAAIVEAQCVAKSIVLEQNSGCDQLLKKKKAGRGCAQVLGEELQWKRLCTL